VELFERQGYLAFENALTPAEIEATRNALSEISRSLMQAAHQGKAEINTMAGVAKNYRGIRVTKPGTNFSIQFEAGVDPMAVAVEEAELKYRKLGDYDREHETFEALVTHKRVKGFLEQLIGQEVVLKNSMALAKPPFIGSEKPWHQDNAYFDYLPLELLGTVWIAVDDATLENGCMHVLPGQHRRGPLRHHHTTDCEIVSDRIDPTQAVPVPLAAGGIMLFSAMLPHQTPPNQTASRRRALQFQYRGVDTHQVSKEEYGKVFAEADGSPASCARASENG
jgi:phytanoyl-CoA hydroxylase